MRAADGNDNGGDVDITIDSNGVDEWVDMIGLWYKGQVRRPYAGAVRDVAFPMTVKPPSGARRTLGFVRIGVQVVHDRKFEGGAGYADTQYFMKFPVPHDWSVKGGWTPMQYSWLRERLAEFPVFDLEELKGHLAEVDLRTVDAGAGESFAAAAAAAQEADAPSASARARKAPRAPRGRGRVVGGNFGVTQLLSHESVPACFVDVDAFRNGRAFPAGANLPAPPLVVLLVQLNLLEEFLGEQPVRRHYPVPQKRRKAGELARVDDPAVFHVVHEKIEGDVLLAL